MSRLGRRLLLAGVTLGLASLAALEVVHRLGYVVQIPFTGLRAPLARRVGPLPHLARPEQAPAPPAGAADPADAFVPFPISRLPALGRGAWGPRYPNPELGWLAPPGAVIADAPASANPMAPGVRPWRQVANNFGFADKDWVVAKPAGEVRVGVFGTSWCQNGSTNEHTIAARLEEHLHQQGCPKVRVLNFGVVSWVAAQELAAYAQLGASFDLDLVLVIDGANDLLAPYHYDPRPGFRFNHFAVETRGQADEKAVRADLARRSGVGTAAWRAELVTAYLATLGRLRRLVPLDRPVVVVPQPVRYHQADKIGDAAEAEFAAHALAVYDDAFDRLARTAGPERLTVVDARGAFRGREDVAYWDYVHTTDVGNDAFGRILAAVLAPALGPR